MTKEISTSYVRKLLGLDGATELNLPPHEIQRLWVWLEVNKGLTAEDTLLLRGKYPQINTKREEGIYPKQSV